QGMSRRLLSLRGVPAEEAQGLREALDAAEVAYYELPPTAFGISAGSIWVRHNHDFKRARIVFDAFQERHAQQARADHVPVSFIVYLRRNPGRVAGYAAAAVLVLLLMFWPVLQLWL
ncbi:MAG: DUF6164 family protein, partial [Wenzhouxiangellaceae bacterium]